MTPELLDILVKVTSRALMEGAFVVTFQVDDEGPLAWGRPRKNLGRGERSCGLASLRASQAASKVSHSSTLSRRRTQRSDGLR